jgi:hypothetical protein
MPSRSVRLESDRTVGELERKMLWCYRGTRAAWIERVFNLKGGSVACDLGVQPGSVAVIGMFEVNCAALLMTNL